MEWKETWRRRRRNFLFSKLKKQFIFYLQITLNKSSKESPIDFFLSTIWKKESPIHSQYVHKLSITDLQSLVMSPLDLKVVHREGQGTWNSAKPWVQSNWVGPTLIQVVDPFWDTILNHGVKVCIQYISQNSFSNGDGISFTLAEEEWQICEYQKKLYFRTSVTNTRIRTNCISTVFWD